MRRQPAYTGSDRAMRSSPGCQACPVREGNSREFGDAAGAVVLGVLVACQLGAHFVQAMVCPVIFADLQCLLPWRKLANEDGPLAHGPLADRWVGRETTNSEDGQIFSYHVGY